MKPIIHLIIFLIIFQAGPLFANDDNKDKNQGPFHYSGKFCKDCHEKAPGIKKQKLKYNSNFNLLCKCHLNTSQHYIHPVDIMPSEQIRKRIPSTFPLKDGKIVCSTCHNIFLQCRKNDFIGNSLRGAPYQKRYDMCYRCHNPENYTMLNPHKQLDEKKNIIVRQCLYCHVEKPDEKYPGTRDVVLKNNIEVLCQRCHNIKGNHSGNVNHLRKPSQKAVQRMNLLKKKYNIILPLDKDGKLTCATCHNPHEKGVIDVNNPSAKGADSRYRHRLPGKLCKECHQM